MCVFGFSFTEKDKSFKIPGGESVILYAKEYQSKLTVKQYKIGGFIY